MKSHERTLDTDGNMTMETLLFRSAALGVISKGVLDYANLTFTQTIGDVKITMTFGSAETKFTEINSLKIESNDPFLINQTETDLLLVDENVTNRDVQYDGTTQNNLVGIAYEDGTFKRLDLIIDLELNMFTSVQERMYTAVKAGTTSARDVTSSLLFTFDPVLGTTVVDSSTSTSGEIVTTFEAANIVAKDPTIAAAI